MVRGMFRSKTFRRISRRVPSGKTSLGFSKRSPKKATCAYCGIPLQGISRKPALDSKSSRRPERPYGGVLCSRCLRSEIKLGARDE